jgi:hypothetical protein
MDVATAFAIDKEAAKAESDKLDQIISKDAQEFSKKVESVTWPGTTKDANSKAAMKFFKESPDWGAHPTKPEMPIGVHIKGSWSVQKRDITGNPTMYGIPAKIAVQKESDKAKGLARVFNVTMRTQESRDPKQAPPFVSITVGDSWYIKADKVK